jgi:hypothetical protein
MFAILQTLVLSLKREWNNPKSVHKPQKATLSNRSSKRSKKLLSKIHQQNQKKITHKKATIKRLTEILTHYGVYLHLDRQQQEQPHSTTIKWLLKIQIKLCDPFFFCVRFYFIFLFILFSAVISNHTTLNYTSKFIRVFFFLVFQCVCVFPHTMHTEKKIFFWLE